MKLTCDRTLSDSTELFTATVEMNYSVKTG